MPCSHHSPFPQNDSSSNLCLDVIDKLRKLLFKFLQQRKINTWTRRVNVISGKTNLFILKFQWRLIRTIRNPYITLFYVKTFFSLFFSSLFVFFLIFFLYWALNSPLFSIFPFSFSLTFSFSLFCSSFSFDLSVSQLLLISYSLLIFK